MSDFWAELDEVLLHKRTRELWHVRTRLKDVDADSEEYPEMFRRYRLECDSHTTEQYWREEDLEDCFIKLGVTTTQKPVQEEELREWYE